MCYLVAGSQPKTLIKISELGHPDKEGTDTNQSARLFRCCQSLLLGIAPSSAKRKHLNF